jgi:ribonuclease VapC
VIVVDTSAIVAILKAESERDAFAGIIAASDGCFLSTVGYLEASMVIVGRGRPQLADELEELLSESAIELVPFDEQQARVSRAAFIRFGKGRHSAGLNFGDCVSYALARSRGLPLLYKGGDFAKTDVVSALG